jgi:mannose-6-phosphate isomerase-like protein (cupin superfamily)
MGQEQQAPHVIGEAFVHTGAADADWFELVPGEKMAVRIPGASVGGMFSLVEAVITPGSATPMHVHDGADETFVVLQGELRFVCGEKTFQAGPGATVFVPRGMAHGFINTGTGDARMLTLFTPGAGLDRLFRYMSETPPESQDALAAGYGTFIVGPVLQAS